MSALLDVNLAGLLIRAFCKCRPCAFLKRNLCHVLLIGTEFPLLSQRYPGFRACGIRRPPGVPVFISVMAECVFIFLKSVYFWNVSLSVSSRFQSCEPSPVFSLTLPLLPCHHCLIHSRIWENPSMFFPQPFSFFFFF